MPIPFVPSRQIALIGIGAGGHAKSVLAIHLSQDSFEVVGLLDQAEPKGGCILGVPLLGNDSQLRLLKAQGVRFAFIGVGTAKDTQARVRVWDWLINEGMTVASTVAPTAIVSSYATLGEGVTIMPGAIIQPAARLGDNVLINTGAIIEHDCQIHDHVHIATGGIVAGGVIVEEGAFIGAGVSVKPGIRIGRGAVVGAGAVVVHDVSPGMTVVGNPARPLREESRPWTIQKAS